MADCYWHGYSGTPGPCHTCQILDERGEDFRIDTVKRCPCGSGSDIYYCCPEELVKYRKEIDTLMGIWIKRQGER
jgi:hypothetical protein